LHFHHLEQWESSGEEGKDTSSPAHKLPRELSREMQKFRNLASRLAQESQKVDAWNGKISRLFSMHLDRVQKARKREYEAYKRREGALTREKNKLLAQNRELKPALDGKRSEILFTRLDLEIM
jgi:hypothetical protein